MLFDTHCHLDRYPNPDQIASEAEGQKIVTIGVTNLPSHFEMGLPHVQAFRYVRLALGFHPMVAAKHMAELTLFESLVARTSHIGEVGLDRSRDGKESLPDQTRAFERVLETVSDRPRLISVHSRNAEHQVLRMLETTQVSHVVWHWFSGTLKGLVAAADAGHYFSVNPAMIRTAKGQALIQAMPHERVLTETDGPYVRVGNRPARPADVALVVAHLAQVWRVSRAEAEHVVENNVRGILSTLDT